MRLAARAFIFPPDPSLEGLRNWGRCAASPVGEGLFTACADRSITASAVRTPKDVQAFVQCAYEFVQEVGFEEARRAFLVECIMEIFSKPGLLLLFAVWLGGLVLFLLFAYQRFRRVYKTQWYDLSNKGPNEEMEWCHIRQLMESDPMRAKERWRWPKWQFLVTDISIAISSYCSPRRRIHTLM